MRVAIYSPSLPSGKNHFKDADWFVYEVLKRLADNYPTHEFIWITPGPASSVEISQKNMVVLPLGKKSAGASAYIRSRYKLPALLKKNQADVLLNLGGDIPTLPIPVCRLIEWPVPAGSRQRQLLQKTASLVVISREDKEKLINHYHIPQQRIVSVHRGIQEGYKPLNWDEREQLKQQYTDSKEYFIYLGAIKQENNMLNLLKAFSILKKRLRSNMVLVLAGELDKDYRAFPELLQTYYFRSDVKWIPQITVAERIALLGAAYGLICPYVPFTIQPEILQAFACRIPAIVADYALNRETGEDAALYFNPFDVENAGNALCEIYKDEDLRGRLIALGDIQAAKYSWDKTTDLIWSAVSVAAGKK